MLVDYLITVLAVTDDVIIECFTNSWCSLSSLLGLLSDFYASWVVCHA